MTRSKLKQDNSEPIIDASGKILTEADLDDDLQEQLATAMPSIRQITLRMHLRTQKERNDTLARREDMTPIVLRRDKTRELLSKEALQKQDIHHIHSVLALCGLPYRKPKLENDTEPLEYTKQCGRVSLTVHAGKLANPFTGQMEQQGLPYGTKSRLLMLHICTRALRQKSPVVDLEDSLSSFIESMGFNVTGGAKGSLRLFKEQITRLSVCHLQIGLFQENRATTINTQPFSKIDLWVNNTPQQRMLWNSTVTLSRDFYDSLQEHALPVDMRSLAAVSHSARQIDILLWLSYRLRSLKRGYLLTWDVLKDQFCQSEQHKMYDFQRDFKKDLQEISAIFAKSLPFTLSEKGMYLLPIDPEDIFVPPVHAKYKGIKS